MLAFILFKLTDFINYSSSLFYTIQRGYKIPYPYIYTHFSTTNREQSLLVRQIKDYMSCSPNSSIYPFIKHLLQLVFSTISVCRDIYMH